MKDSLLDAANGRRTFALVLETGDEVIGDIAMSTNGPTVHGHVVLAKADGSAHGGHLVSAHVRPTLEVILTESPRHLRRKMDAESGLPLIDPSTPQDAGSC
jgi:predicted DNA-binding protein with PD1-like motif